MQRYESLIDHCISALETEPINREWANRLIYRMDFIQVHLDKFGSKRLLIMKQDDSPLIANILNLLDNRTQGKTTLSLAKYDDAVLRFTWILQNNAESPKFSAIVAYLRAVAYLHKNQLADAIRDCSLALALDPSMKAALSLRAQCYFTLRCFELATEDLQRL